MDCTIPAAAAAPAFLLSDPNNQQSNSTMVLSSQFVLTTETRDTEAAEHASDKDDVLRMIEILTDLRSEGLEREGVQLPLLLVVTDAGGRDSFPSRLLESIGGSRLWPPNDGGTDSAATPRLPVTLHSRACPADEPSSYAIEYNNEKKELVDRSEFPAHVDRAFKDLCLEDNELDNHHQQQREPPIVLRLSSEYHLDLSNVYFRWEKGAEHEGEETSYIEYNVGNQPSVKAISWNKLEEEMRLAREKMDELGVQSDILIRTRSPHVHSIPTVYRFDLCPSTEDSEQVMEYDGQTKAIKRWEHIRRDVNVARFSRRWMKSGGTVCSPIVLHVREPTAALDLIRVDLPQDVGAAAGDCSRSVVSVASVVAQLLEPAAEESTVLLSVLFADEKQSRVFTRDLLQLLQKFTVVQQNIDDLCSHLTQEIKHQEMVRRRQLQAIPIRRGARRLAPSIEMVQIKAKVFQDLELYMLCGGITMFSDDEQLHYATRVSSMFRKYTTQLRPEEELFPPEEQFYPSNSPATGDRTQRPFDVLVVLNLLKQLDIVQSWSYTMVTELHDYTKLFVFRVLDKHVSFYPNLLKKYRDATLEALLEASVVCRSFISQIVTDEKAIALGVEVGGVSVHTISQLRGRYKRIELQITWRLRNTFSEAVDTNMKSIVIARTRYKRRSTLVELDSSAPRIRAELRASITTLTDSMEKISLHENFTLLPE